LAPPSADDNPTSDHDLPFLATTDATAGRIPTDPSSDTASPDQVVPTHTCQPRQSYASTVRPINCYSRSRVWRGYQALGGRRGRLNGHLRELLSKAIFLVENDLEHHQPNHPTVLLLRTIRNCLYDDLGWNEHLADPCPEAAHAA